MARRARGEPRQTLLHGPRRKITRTTSDSLRNTHHTCCYILFPICQCLLDRTEKGKWYTLTHPLPNFHDRNKSSSFTPLWQSHLCCLKISANLLIRTICAFTFSLLFDALDFSVIFRPIYSSYQSRVRLQALPLSLSYRRVVAVGC
jgi:hypothetical protein